MSEFEFVIQDNVEIPKREFAGERAHRESQYPIAKMHQGQSFALPINGVDGAKAKDKEGNEITLTAAEDAKRQASQKQSYFSSLGKRENVKVVTRYFPEGEVNPTTGKPTGQPTLRVWHDGPRPADEPKADEQPQAAAQPAQEPQDTADEELDL